MPFEQKDPTIPRKDYATRVYKEVSADDKRFTYIKNQFLALKGRQQEREDRLKEVRRTREELQGRYDSALKARAFIQKVAQDTQAKLEYRISNLVDLALLSIFPDPDKFIVRFEQRRNKTECDLLFGMGDETLDPIKSEAGGVLDIASFALRCAFWSLKKGARPILWLDEPSKFLHSPEFQIKCSEMMRHVAEELGLQLIIISDQQGMLDAADKVFLVEKKRGVSNVTEI